jgi:cysteinyl-tRNA synthetase
MHTGLVRYEGRKMSKSLGNLVLVSQALERAPAAAVRLYLASHRYRRDWSFEWSGLAKMARLVERIRALLEGEVRGAGALTTGAPAAKPREGAAGAGPGARRGAARRALPGRFAAALADDLDTPSAIRELRAALRAGDRDAVRSMLAVLAGTASLS